MFLGVVVLLGHNGVVLLQSCELALAALYLLLCHLLEALQLRVDSLVLFVSGSQHSVGPFQLLAQHRDLAFVFRAFAQPFFLLPAELAQILLVSNNFPADFHLVLVVPVGLLLLDGSSQIFVLLVELPQFDLCVVELFGFVAEGQL